MMNAKRYRSSPHSQNGTFVVEFAVISFILALVMAFCGDLVVRLSTKGKLDRAAYSAVTVAKERTALFSGVEYHLLESNLRQSEFDDLAMIVKASLSRTMGHFDEQMFGMTLDVVGYSTAGQLLASVSVALDGDDGIACEPLDTMSQLATTLALTSTPSLYRVTLCYKTDNWFGGLMGVDYGVVSSSAVSVGR